MRTRTPQRGKGNREQSFTKNDCLPVIHSVGDCEAFTSLISSLRYAMKIATWLILPVAYACLKD
jgi:hypothetical protein